MTVDEEGPMPAQGSDHYWITVELQVQKRIERKIEEQHWNIGEWINWRQFRETLEGEVDILEEEMKREGEPYTMLELGYKELVAAMCRVGQEVIGE